MVITFFDEGVAGEFFDSHLVNLPLSRFVECEGTLRERTLHIYEGIWVIMFQFLTFSILQIRTLRGHSNEKNFVGLAVNSEYIACGSETNEVFVYHKVCTTQLLMPFVLQLHFLFVFFQLL